MDSSLVTRLEDATYFKYCPLNNLDRFLDIVLMRRLYGALYHELNDPMEGKFCREGLVKKQLDEIYSLLKRTRICSMMMKRKDQAFPNDFLMWSHYADSHNGCCLELKITEKNNSRWQLIPVKYTNILPKPTDSGKDSIKIIISSKNELWKGENEVRAFRIYDKENLNLLSPYYGVKINAIYLGEKIRYDKRDFIKRIVKSIDKNIPIFKIKSHSSIQDLYPSLTFKAL